jgi:uncharacterized linocin/CFP29 family protein
MDFILNGQAQGSVASTLLNNGFDVAALRPWIGKDGRHYIAQNDAGKLIARPLMNATATLRKEEWKVLDDAVVIAAKERLRIVADIRGAGLTYNIPNGMGKTVLESQTMGDITPATISMDPARKSEGDRPEFGLINLPLPVIHKDFYFNARQVATSRNTGAPIDTTMAQLAARRVSEEAEKLTLGVSSTYAYGGGTVYGFVNFPQRITQSLTDPEDTGWSPAALVRDVLSMRQKSVEAMHFGPWVLYNSPFWDEYLDDDYSDQKGDNTLRQRLEVINGINGVRTADFLTGKQLVLVQMTTDVVRMVVGMDVTTLQWETEGGMRLNFKVMAIIVPQLRSSSDSAQTAGIIHGVAA